MIGRVVNTPDGNGVVVQESGSWLLVRLAGEDLVWCPEAMAIVSTRVYVVDGV